MNCAICEGTDMVRIQARAIPPTPAGSAHRTEHHVVLTVEKPEAERGYGKGPVDHISLFACRDCKTVRMEPAP